MGSESDTRTGCCFLRRLLKLPTRTRLLRLTDAAVESGGVPWIKCEDSSESLLRYIAGGDGLPALNRSRSRSGSLFFWRRMMDFPVILKWFLAPTSGAWLPPEDWVEEAKLPPLLFIRIINCIVSGMVFSTTEVCLLN